MWNIGNYFDLNMLAPLEGRHMQSIENYFDLTLLTPFEERL